MQVKLTNTGDGLRIMYDIHHQERQIRPGKALTVDLDPRFVSRLQKAETNGDTLLVGDLDDDDQAELDAAGKGGAYTHGDGGGLMRVKPNPDGTFDPKSIQEALGHKGTPQKAHGADTSTDPAANKEGGPGLDDGNVDADEDLIKKGVRENAAKAANDRIKSNAQNAADKVNAQSTPVVGEGEPTTAAQLLAVHDSIDPKSLLRLAVAILPPNSLPQKPRPSQIIEGLTRQARMDAKKKSPDPKKTSAATAKAKASDGSKANVKLTTTPPNKQGA